MNSIMNRGPVSPCHSTRVPGVARTLATTHSNQGQNGGGDVALSAPMFSSFLSSLSLNVWGAFQKSGEWWHF